MKPETTSKLKFGVWGLVFGAVITMIVGFSWGGWTTAATTKKMAEEAVLAGQSAICVSQFMTGQNQEERMKEFAKVSRWQRADFIEKGGWDKMPGQEEADYGVSRACAEGLGLLIKN